MVVLADTTVWVDHLRNSNPHLEELLNEGSVAVHPFVVGEIACGKIKNRHEILSLLTALPGSAMVSHSELLHFIESRHLHGKGMGLVDMHLLASAELIGAMLWTMDKALRGAADKLELSYDNS